jgi:bifunctional ADP-heptose synthase (sugar kinase/adenylyltransferase)
MSEIIASLECVDYVTVLDEKKLADLLRKIKSK